MDSLRTLAGEAGYYVDAHYEFDFLILMPGSKLSGTQKDGLLTDMVYTLYLPPLEGNAELYTLEVGVENLNTDSPQYCIYRPIQIRLSRILPVILPSISTGTERSQRTAIQIGTRQ